MEREEIGQSKSYKNVRAVLHIGMGGIYLLFGFIIATYKNFMTRELGTGMAYAIGGLMIAYGAFRLYRGFADIAQMRRERRERR
jgi:hypothetical protein